MECRESLDRWHERRRGKYKQVSPPEDVQALLARIRALFDCLHFLEEKQGEELGDFQVLDVGAGKGKGLTPFLLANFSLKQLHGIDLFEERVREGNELLPGIDLVAGDATEMTMFADGSFDLTMEQFCFCHVMDDSVIRRIASEMLRVTKSGGYLLVMDWVVGRKAAHYNGVPKGKILSLFGTGTETEIVRRLPVALAPPIGRILSRYLPWAYPVVAAALPFLVLSRLTLLRKK